MKVVIVGGVAGGATAAARLRRLDENAEIFHMPTADFHILLVAPLKIQRLLHFRRLKALTSVSMLQ